MAVQTQIDYHTVFTVLQKSAPWQEFLIVPLVLLGIVIIGAIGTVVAIIQRRRLPPILVICTVFLCAMLLLVAAYLFNGSGVQDMYGRAKDAFVQGQYFVVEGTVTNFHPMPYSGHQNETFSVNGVQFSYSDFVLVPCFNNTPRMVARYAMGCTSGFRIRAIAS